MKLSRFYVVEIKLSLKFFLLRKTDICTQWLICNQIFKSYEIEMLNIILQVLSCSTDESERKLVFRFTNVLDLAFSTPLPFLSGNPPLLVNTMPHRMFISLGFSVLFRAGL